MAFFEELICTQRLTRFRLMLYQSWERWGNYLAGGMLMTCQSDYRRLNSNVFYPWMSILAHINESFSLLDETVEYRAAGFSAKCLSWFWVGEEFSDLRDQTSGICICIWIMKNDHSRNKTFIIKKTCHAGWQGHFETF